MKIFYLVSRVPYPLDKGDKLRAYHQLIELSKEHEIYLCCLDDNNTEQNHIDHLREICAEVYVFKLSKIQIGLNLFGALFSSKPFQVHYFYQRSIHRSIKRLLKEIQPEHIFAQLIRTTEYVKDEHDVPKTLDYMDVFSKGIERRIKSAKFKSIFKSEAQRLVKYEHLIFDYFELKTIISEQDKNLIYHKDRNEIVVVPNGIDLEKYQPRATKKEYDLIFVGNMSYAPNIDTAVRLVNDILPKLLEFNPDLTLTIAGASPSKEVLALQGPNVNVSGWIDDICDAYAKGTVFTAPLRIGTGLQNKLLEAMAMGIPSITSDLANNALKAKEGQEIFIGLNDDDYVQKIIHLLENKEEREELAEAGRNYVSTNFSWKSSGQQLNQLIKALSES